MGKVRILKQFVSADQEKEIKKRSRNPVFNILIRSLKITGVLFLLSCAGGAVILPESYMFPPYLPISYLWFEPVLIYLGVLGFICMHQMIENKK